MATLAGQKVKDKYGNLLHVEGGVTSNLKVIEDGGGTDTALSVSTSNVEVEALSFGSQPSLTTGETQGLFVQTSGAVVKQSLVQSAFTLPTLNSGTGVLVAGSYPTYTITNTDPDQVVSITGTDISVGGSYPNFSLTNTAPDQTVTISGTGGVDVTGTYPNFTVDGSSVTGVHEEMFVGVLETSYPLGVGAPQVIAFSNADNGREDRSYHFGTAPAKLSTPTTEVVLNSSGADQIVYIDMSAYIQVNGNNKDITYRLQTNPGPGWVTKQEATRTKSEPGLHVDSFWGIFIVADGEQLRIQVESSTGDVEVTTTTQVKFQVKEKGNII